MSSQNIHISDRELLMAADGELSSRRAAQVRTHLAACWNCRARMTEIDGAIVDFARTYREVHTDALPPPAAPRALLSAQLAELASNSGGRPGSFSLAVRAAVLCVAVCGAALLGKMALQHHRAGSTDTDPPSLERGVVPDAHFTPGSTRTTTLDELCSSAHEEVVGQVSSPLRSQVLREYGIVNSRAGDYEIDYLIAPGLGGTEDIRNLWPQPYNAKTWNAYTKDALEERLHLLVCGRKLELAVAQADIARNWVNAYKRYFQTDEPLPSTADLDYPETPESAGR